jgi:pilus assembly protein CpaE
VYKVRDKIDIMVAGRSKTVLGVLDKQLQNPNYKVRQRHISNGHSNPLYGISELPDILVFHLSSLGEDEVNSLFENPAASRPATIIIGPADNMKCIRLSMQAGVADYLEEPLDEEELHRSLERIAGNLGTSTPTTQSSETLMTAVVSTKGGCGASFLAANLAHVMAVEGKEQVALLDLDLQFGSLAQYLDIKPQHGLVTALDMADQLDAMALNAYMAKHASGLALMSPMDDEIILPRDIDSTRFTRILDLLRQSYSRIVVDLPRQIDELSADIYERTDNILLVTQQEFASVRDANRLRNLILSELSVPADRISVVINRYDKNSAVELGDIGRSMGIDKKDFILIPNSYKSVAESINIGIPMLEHARNSLVTRAIVSASHQLEGREPDSQTDLVSRVLSNINVLSNLVRG